MKNNSHCFNTQGNTFVVAIRGWFHIDSYLNTQSLPLKVHIQESLVKAHIETCFVIKLNIKLYIKLRERMRLTILV